MGYRDDDDEIVDGADADDTIPEMPSFGAPGTPGPADGDGRASHPRYCPECDRELEDGVCANEDCTLNGLAPPSD